MSTWVPSFRRTRYEAWKGFAREDALGHAGHHRRLVVRVDEIDPVREVRPEFVDRIPEDALGIAAVGHLIRRGIPVVQQVTARVDHRFVAVLPFASRILLELPLDRHRREPCTDLDRRKLLRARHAGFR
jgi:hypothetical protein